MLSRFRGSARRFGLFALLAFLAPGVAVDCREMSALTGGGMACCQGPADEVGLRAECCAVGGELPASERPASTAASARSSSHSLAAEALPAPLGGPALVPALGTLGALDTGSPPGRLYIRFGAIRR
jgi:hypothetical protein